MLPKSKSMFISGFGILYIINSHASILRSSNKLPNKALVSILKIQNNLQFITTLHRFRKISVQRVSATLGRGEMFDDPIFVMLIVCYRKTKVILKIVIFVDSLNVMLHQSFIQ